MSRKPSPAPQDAPLFELGGLFATVETIATTPLDELDLPRETLDTSSAGAIRARLEAKTTHRRPLETLEEEAHAEATADEGDPAAVRAMFRGLGWGVTE